MPPKHGTETAPVKRQGNPFMKSLMLRAALCAALALCAPSFAADLDALLKPFPAQNAAELDAACAPLMAGGAPLVAELCGRIQPEGSADADIAPRYALTGLVKWVGTPANAAGRPAVAAGVATALGTAADPSVKAFLAVQLQWIGGPDEVPALAALLADPATMDPAVSALESIGGDAAGAALLAALEKADTAGKARLVKTLGVMGHAPAVPACAALAADGDAALRLAALQSLADLGAVEGVQPLVDALAHTAVSPGERDALLAAAEKLGERLAAGGKTAEAEALFAALGKQPETHARIAALLGGVAVRGQKAAPELAAALDDPDAKVRGAALKAAAGLGDAKTCALLVKKTKGLPPEAKAQAVAALARWDDPAAHKAVAAAVGDKDAAVRGAALATMDGATAREARKALFSMVLKADESKERKAARDALMRVPEPELSDGAAKALDRASADAKPVLLEMLQARAMPEHADAVVKQLGDKDEAVRVAALNALGAMAEEKHMARLYEELRGAASDTAALAARKALSDTANRSLPRVADGYHARARTDLQEVTDAAQAGRLMALMLDMKPGGAARDLSAYAVARYPLDARNQAAALLGDHRDPSALRELAALAGNAAAGEIHPAVLEALCRQFSRAEEQTPLFDAMAALLRNGGLRSADEKRQALKALSAKRLANAASAAAMLLDDAEVAQDAAAAVADIACMKGEKDKGLSDAASLAALEKAKGVTQDAAVRERIEKHLAAGK